MKVQVTKTLILRCLYLSSFICIEQTLHGGAMIRRFSSSVEKYFTLCNDFKNALCLSSVRHLLVQSTETASFWDDG